MFTKIISITTLSLFVALISLGANHAHAESEVTGSLSTGLSNNSSETSVDGSLAGSVVSDDTVSGNISGTVSGTVSNSSGGSGGSGGSSGSNNGSDDGLVLGASIDSPPTTNPGLPETGMLDDQSGAFTTLLATILVLLTVPMRLLSYEKA